VIDLARLRDESEYRTGIERKGVDPALLDEVVGAYENLRRLNTEVQELRARQNAVSKEIGRAAAEERPRAIESAAALKSELGEYEQKLGAAEREVRERALSIPNPADGSVPDGGEDDAEVVRVVGEPGPAPALDHAEYGEHRGFVDAERAVAISGSRFVYLMREAALLELALVQWAMRRVVEAGFVAVVPPVLVREEAMEEAGFFPTDRYQVYEVDDGDDDKLYLVGTSEIPLAALHRGEIVDADALPIRYAGVSTCFRREAGTYGKDTRGIFRLHQFDKVEMFSFAHPDRSWDELEEILALEETIFTDLGLPYRVVNIAAGDLGAAAAKKYDIEAWLPSEGRYRELTSCSNYTDYSARRLGTRFKADGGTQLVHTLNGTGCAIGRTLLFLFEHYQDSDGTFVVPDVLVSYTGFSRVEPR
jgi:seryl-tRNA synthetase